MLLMKQLQLEREDLIVGFQIARDEVLHEELFVMVTPPCSFLEECSNNVFQGLLKTRSLASPTTPIGGFLATTFPLLDPRLAIALTLAWPVELALPMAVLVAEMTTSSRALRQPYKGTEQRKQ